MSNKIKKFKDTIRESNGRKEQEAKRMAEMEGKPSQDRDLSIKLGAVRNMDEPRSYVVSKSTTDKIRTQETKDNSQLNYSHKVSTLKREYEAEPSAEQNLMTEESVAKKAKCGERNPQLTTTSVSATASKDVDDSQKFSNLRFKKLSQNILPQADGHFRHKKSSMEFPLGGGDDFPFDRDAMLEFLKGGQAQIIRGFQVAGNAIGNN